MARILISESHDDVRRLLERMVTRLGHEPIAARSPTPQQLTSADVFILEPAAPIGAVLAQAAHLIDPTLPLICASVTAPPPELAELGISFTATLVKPFTLQQLGGAIELALRARRARRRDPRHGNPGHGSRAA
jgi:DNA-binding NtrC family response regulator